MGTQVTGVRADLATTDAVEKLWSEVEKQGRAVDAIAINAGVGVGGDFTRETDLDEESKMIQLNLTSTVHLAKWAVVQR
jgi:short-subunit dehydrogenase